MSSSTIDRRQWVVVVAISLSVTVFTAMQGLTYPLLALILHRGGTPEWLIGINAATMPLGMILAASFAPHWIVRLGGRRLAALSLVGASTTLFVIGWHNDPWLWMALRLGMGICLGNTLIVTETWINEAIDDEYRGRALGLYSALLSIGFAFGPTLLLLIGTDGRLPFLIGSLFPLLALAVLISVRIGLPPQRVERRTLSALSFLSMAPLLVVCAGAVAFADEAAMSLLPIYLLDHGYTERASNLALILMIAGSISLQIPIGWLADRVSRTAVMAGCALVAAVSAASFPILATIPVAFGLVVFLWGGSYYALYVLSLIRLGESFKGSALVAGNAAFAAMWGLGGILGPTAVGFAMSNLGSVGLPLVFGVLFASVGLATIMSRRCEPFGQ